MQRSHAADAGLPTRPISDIRGGDAAYNPRALRGLLMGEPGAYRDAVSYNAGEALVVAGPADKRGEGGEDTAEASQQGLAHGPHNCPNPEKSALFYFHTRGKRSNNARTWADPIG